MPYGCIFHTCDELRMESTPPLLEIVDAIVTLSFRLAEKTSLLCTVIQPWWH